MQVIPVVNCQDLESVQSRVKIAQEFLCDHGSSARSTTQQEAWLHVDIADGGFTDGYETWRNPDDIKKIARDPHLKIEVHLMVNEPELVLEQWLAAGVQRIIVHIATVSALDTLVNMAAEKGIEVWLAIAPQTPVEKVFPYVELVKGCQILTVKPGLPHQTMLPGMLEKVQTLRKQFPLLPIEVDGGITAETIKQCAAAGATQVVAGSAIFDAAEPGAAYWQLVQAAQ